MKFNTSLLHGAFRGEPQTGATLTPIYQSSAFEQESAERLEKIFHNQAPGFSYTRINNPTVEALISSGILKHSESRLIMSKTTISMHSAK